MASNNEEAKVALASEDATPAADIDPSLVTTGSPVEGGCVYTSFKANPTLPADATTKISTLSDLVSLGDLSPDGFTASRSVTVNEFKGWHQSIVLTKVSEEKHQYKMVFIKSVRSSVAKLRYGAGNVETNEDGTFSHIKAVASTASPSRSSRPRTSLCSTSTALSPPRRQGHNENAAPVLPGRPFIWEER